GTTARRWWDRRLVGPILRPARRRSHRQERRSDMSVVTLTINGQLVSARADDTILLAAREAGIALPTLCYLEGLSAHGGCRVCLVEIAGSSRLQPACFMKVSEGMEVQTATDRLREYRRMIVELLFAEGNHICAVCVANGACELQDMASAVGM